MWLPVSEKKTSQLPLMASFSPNSILCSQSIHSPLCDKCHQTEMGLHLQV